MKYKGYTCPICGNNNPSCTSYYDYDIHCTVEEYIECDICNYYYEYAYGHYIEYFCSNEFAWSYMTKGNELDKLMRKMKRSTFMARRNWRKGLRKKFKVAYKDLKP